MWRCSFLVVYFPNKKANLGLSEIVCLKLIRSCIILVTYEKINSNANPNIRHRPTLLNCL